MQGYKRRNAYIATQSPLQNTVGDLWRMMWEFKSKVMVMLCSFTEDGHEVCHPFWPNNEGDMAKYGKINVIFQSTTTFSLENSSSTMTRLGSQLYTRHNQTTVS